MLKVRTLLPVLHCLRHVEIKATFNKKKSGKSRSFESNQTKINELNFIESVHER